MCKVCGNPETFSRTYTTATGVTYTLSYLTCKHPPPDTGEQK